MNKYLKEKNISIRNTFRLTTFHIARTNPAPDVTVIICRENLSINIKVFFLKKACSVLFTSRSLCMKKSMMFWNFEIEVLEITRLTW